MAQNREVSYTNQAKGIPQNQMMQVARVVPQGSMQGHGTLQQQGYQQTPIQTQSNTLTQQPQQQQQQVTYQQPQQFQQQQVAGNPQWGMPVVQATPQYQGTSAAQGQSSLNLNSMDPLDTMLGPFPCVRVRGLPFEATAHDVVMFFQGLVVLDVILPKRTDGRVSGEAFVVFSNQMDTQQAIQRDRGTMGHRYLEVFQALRLDYYQGCASVSGNFSTSDRSARFTGASPASSLTEHTGFLRLRGLPFSARHQDIVDFFRGYNYEEDSIEFVRRPDGRMTGECYIKFPTVQDAKRAMDKDRSLMGSRYVELFISAVDEYERVTGKSA